MDEPVSACGPGYLQGLLEQSRRVAVPSDATLLAAAPKDLPEDWKPAYLRWARNPEMPYSQLPDKVYDMAKFRQLVAASNCLKTDRYKAQVAAEKAMAGMTIPAGAGEDSAYGTKFYVGIGLLVLALTISITGRK